MYAWRMEKPPNEKAAYEQVHQEMEIAMNRIEESKVNIQWLQNEIDAMSARKRELEMTRAGSAAEASKEELQLNTDIENSQSILEETKSVLTEYSAKHRELSIIAARLAGKLRSR